MISRNLQAKQLLLNISLTIPNQKSLHIYQFFFFYYLIKKNTIPQLIIFFYTIDIDIIQNSLIFQIIMAQINMKTKKYRQPRQPRSEPYQKVNAYTQAPSVQQILTLLIFVVLVVVHEIFVTTQVNSVQHPILWAMLGFRYALILILAYDYIWLTVTDPVDRLIIDETLRYKFSPYQLRNCSLCATTVQCSSHHCMSCNRCTQDFDHHCKFLNNCIGVRNYQNFIRILIIFTSFQFIGIGMGIWILIENQSHYFLKTYKKWIIVGYICISGIVTIVICSLLAFHIYISCCANITTLEYVNPPPQIKPKIVVIEPSPLSAEYFRKTIEDNRNIHDQGKKNNQKMEFYRK